MEYYYPMQGNNWDWGWGFGIMLIWLLFIIILSLVVIRALRGHDVLPEGKNAALDIAKKRYAKGEITKEEFQQLKKDLA